MESKGSISTCASMESVHDDLIQYSQQGTFAVSEAVTTDGNNSLNLSYKNIASGRSAGKLINHF